MDDPNLCHDHSTIPEVWPSLQDINQYQARVRARLTSILASGRVGGDQDLQRAIWLVFEHEMMHLETYLVMLLQSPTIKPPPGVMRPDFKQLADKAAAKVGTNLWFTIPKTEVVIGMNDAEDDLVTQRPFGWDNEKPARKVLVREFMAQARPITNHEYADYLLASFSFKFPASWVQEPDDGKALIDSHDGTLSQLGSLLGTRTSVRTVFGLVPLRYALHWPVMASYDELAAFAKWVGGRIPTLEEVKCIYSHADAIKKEKFVEKVSSTLISAVNGHVPHFY